MANLLRGERTFTHEGTEYTLALDMDAFTEACMVLDMGLQAFMEALDAEDPKPHVLRALFYGAMFRYNPIPVKDCMSFMTAYGLEKIAAELKALALTVMPEQKAPVGNAEAPKQPGNRQQRRATAKKKTNGGGKKKA